MSARINLIYRIIAAVAIQVQAVDILGIQVSGIVGRDKASPLGTVVTGIAVVETSLIIVVITTVTNGSVNLTIFYHFPRTQSRKSLPDRNDPGGLVRPWFQFCQTLFYLLELDCFN